MDDFSPSDLKTILHSKRANLYYIEHCRILVNGGRVEYLSEQGRQAAYWNVPIANTTCLLLGTGTSITQAAMRELARAGVMVGFCGGGGSPLFAGTEALWISSQSEYRPTEYLQQWVQFWFDDERRLSAAKAFQRVRAAQVAHHWTRAVTDGEWALPIDNATRALSEFTESLEAANSTADVLAREAALTKRLYQMAARAVDLGEFRRAKGGSGTDLANQYLDHGNYLAYGLAATATWVLGIPHALAIVHGKTRRGALVFDVADLIKDALVLPQAFISATAGDDDQAFRTACLQRLRSAGALDTMIDTLKDVAAASAVP